MIAKIRWPRIASQIIWGRTIGRSMEARSERYQIGAMARTGGSIDSIKGRFWLTQGVPLQLKWWRFDPRSRLLIAIFVDPPIPNRTAEMTE
jgi:hypothetical protein